MLIIENSKKIQGLKMIKLLAKKGKKTWCGRVINKDLKLDFLQGEWSKERRGVLEYKLDKTGFYMSQDTKRQYWQATENDNGEIIEKEITKDELIKLMVDWDSISFEKRDFSFTVVKPGPRNTAWDMFYKPIGEVFFAEDEDYYFISGKFHKTWTKYKRNFSAIDSMGEKEEMLDKKMFHKVKDNIKIEFCDEGDTITTQPVFVDENSSVVPGPHPDFVGVLKN